MGLNLTIIVRKYNEIKGNLQIERSPISIQSRKFL